MPSSDDFFMHYHKVHSQSLCPLVIEYLIQTRTFTTLLPFGDDIFNNWQKLELLHVMIYILILIQLWNIFFFIYNSAYDIHFHVQDSEYFSSLFDLLEPVVTVYLIILIWHMLSVLDKNVWNNTEN